MNVNKLSCIAFLLVLKCAALPEVTSRADCMLVLAEDNKHGTHAASILL